MSAPLAEAMFVAQLRAMGCEAFDIGALRPFSCFSQGTAAITCCSVHLSRRSMLNRYLPKRYLAGKAHVVDSKGAFSEQIDVVVFDRQYSPFIFDFESEAVIPAESVYAAFEAKQSINARLVEYAHKKLSSVRKLHRTSLPIPSASGTLPAKLPVPIIGRILTFESDWNPPLGEPPMKALTGELIAELQEVATVPMIDVRAYAAWLKS